MKIILQSALILSIAQLIAVLKPDILVWYYALTVIVMVTVGLRTGCPWYTRITLLLFLGFVFENNPYLWHEDFFAMGAIHLLLATSIFFFCKTAGSKAYLYISSIAGLKVLCDMFQHYAIIFPSIYIYHAAINVLSILAIVWFINMSIERRKLIINRDQRIDPILLKIELWTNQMHTTITRIMGNESRS